MAFFGSSPLARGTCRQHNVLVRALRLIPARAGNMSRPRRREWCSSAHPRSRGEHLVEISSCMAFFGSSPLARGTCRQHNVLVRALRLIPARAGNISNSSLSSDLMAAHPRSRGEHTGPVGGVTVRAGSSPLARGTWVGTGEVCREFRLIPARAGNISRTRPGKC